MKWEQSITSINSYVQSLKEEGIDADVTVAAFSSFPKYRNNIVSTNLKSIDFNVIRNEVNLKNFSPISYTEVSPNGNTPLYDATGELLNLADKKSAKKTVIIIVTDGEENSSKDYSLKAIKDRISTCKNRGWEVLFLGAEFNPEYIAGSFGIGAEKIFRSVPANKIKDGMIWYAAASASYASGKLGASGIDTTSMKSKIEG